MVTHSWHKRHSGCKLLHLLPEQVPDGLDLPHLIRAHPRIGDIPIQEHEVEGVFDPVVVDSIGNNMTHRSIGSHVSDGNKVDSVQVGCLIGRGNEGVSSGKHSQVLISNLVVIPLVGLETRHHGSIYSPIKPNLPFVVAGPGRISLHVQLPFALPILDNRPGVPIRLTDPHDLHLPIVPCESQMQLFRSQLDGYSDGEPQHLIHRDN